MENLIQAEIENYSVGNKYLLTDIKFSLKRNEFIVILGRNGAGKSSLLKHLSGEISNSKAKIIVRDHLVEHYSINELAQFRSVLTQELHLSFNLSVFELVKIGRFSSHQNEDLNLIIMKCLECVGLEKKAAQDYASLSGGEKQRAQIARTLAQIYDVEDAIYLLDEPTNSLDISYQYEILKLIKKLAKERFGAIAILHDLNLASQFADKILLLDEGKIISWGSPREVLNEKNIESAFKHQVVVLEHPTMQIPLIVSNFSN